jgi:hypothetical protein
MDDESRVTELEAALEEAQRKFVAQTNELERITEDYQQCLKDAEAEIETTSYALRLNVSRRWRRFETRSERDQRCGVMT